MNKNTSKWIYRQLLEKYMETKTNKLEFCCGLCLKRHSQFFECKDCVVDVQSQEAIWLLENNKEFVEKTYYALL